MTADGWDGVHLGEATAHAWLDGALPPDEAARAEAHVATCADCTALVAEARGLIAGASRILGALDAVPAGVLPAAPVAVPTIRKPAPRRWWTGAPARAAAAVLLLAGGSAVVLRDRGVPARSVAAADSVQIMESRAVADSAASAPAVSLAAPLPAPPPAAEAPESAPAVVPRRGARVAADAAPVAPPVAAPMGAPTAAPAPAPPVAAAPPPAPASEGSAARGESRRDEARRETAAKATPGAADAMVAERRAAAPARVQSLVENVAAAAGVITGRVVSADGRPVGAAQVQIAGTTLGATTDSTGAFRLRPAAPGAATLRVQRIGFRPDSARVLTRGADTVATTVVLTPATLALSQVVTTAASGAPPAAWRATAGAAVGCWAVRPARGWTAAAPTLPAVLRLDREGREPGEGPATVADAAQNAAWRAGRWTVVDTSEIQVTLPATGGEADLALRRVSRGWRGTATWSASTPSTRPVAPTDVQLTATRCPAR